MAPRKYLQDLSQPIIHHVGALTNSHCSCLELCPEMAEETQDHWIYRQLDHQPRLRAVAAGGVFNGCPAGSPTVRCQLVVLNNGWSLVNLGLNGFYCNKQLVQIRDWMCHFKDQRCLNGGGIPGYMLCIPCLHALVLAAYTPVYITYTSTSVHMSPFAAYPSFHFTVNKQI